MLAICFGSGGSGRRGVRATAVDHCSCAALKWSSLRCRRRPSGIIWVCDVELKSWILVSFAVCTLCCSQFQLTSSAGGCLQGYRAYQFEALAMFGATAAAAATVVVLSSGHGANVSADGSLSMGLPTLADIWIGISFLMIFRASAFSAWWLMPWGLQKEEANGSLGKL